MSCGFYLPNSDAASSGHDRLTLTLENAIQNQKPTDKSSHILELKWLKPWPVVTPNLKLGHRPGSLKAHQPSLWRSLKIVGDGYLPMNSSARTWISHKRILRVGAEDWQDLVTKRTKLVSLAGN